MFTLLHGEDTIQSLKALDSLKESARQSGKEIYSLDSSTFTLAAIETLQGKSLFGQEALIVVENFWSKNKKLDFPLPEVTDVVFWESRRLSSVPKLTNLQTKVFDLPVIVFRLVDSLAPGNQKVFLPLFREYCSSEAVEIVFTMIVRQFRLLILVSAGGHQESEDVKNLQPWQVAKVSKQAGLFKMEKLKHTYAQLLEIDYRFKSGVISDLTPALEVLLWSL